MVGGRAERGLVFGVLCKHQLTPSSLQRLLLPGLASLPRAGASRHLPFPPQTSATPWRSLLCHGGTGSEPSPLSAPNIFPGDVVTNVHTHNSPSPEDPACWVMPGAGGVRAQQP